MLGFGGGESVDVMGGLMGRTAPKKKTVYRMDGSAVEVDSGVPTSNYDPNVGYGGDHYFNAPPPPRQEPVQPPTPAQVQQEQTQLGMGTQQLANITPNVAPIASNQQRSPVTQGAYEGQAQTQLEADLAAKTLTQRASLNDSTFEKRLAALSAANGGAPGGTPTTTYTPAFNEEAARAAAFSRAKSQAGATANASLQALQDVMAGRGLRGSTIESNETANIIGGVGGEINNFTGDQLMQDLSRAAQISDREASAGLTRRGQDMQQSQSLMALLNSMGSLY